MMSRHSGLNSELTRAIAKRPPHAKNQLSVLGSFFNQFVTDTYTRIYIYNELIEETARHKKKLNFDMWESFSYGYTKF